MLRVSMKLPLAIVGSALIVAAGIGVASYQTAKSSMATIAQDHMQAAAENAGSQFLTYLDTIERDLRSVATNPVTAQAISGFSRAWNVLNDPQESLQAAYIENNPNPIGEKQNLDNAQTGAIYDTIHANFHPWFRDLQQSSGYYDVFLLDTEGNLIYSVFKELDYATNFSTNGGQWAATDLGEVYRAAMNAPADNPVVFEDFAPYGPSSDAPASFIAHAVRDQFDQIIGVLAYQMPVDAINAVFTSIGGLGASGEAVLIGEDGFMRNDSTRTPDQNDILQTQLSAPFITAALNGNQTSGTGTFHRQMHMQANAYGFQFHGSHYAVVALKSTQEMYAPVIEIRNRMAMIGCFLLGLIGVSGWLISRSITQPISTLVGEMRQLSQGDTHVELHGTTRADEIGDMTRAVAVFRDAMVERKDLENQGIEAAKQRQERQQNIDRLIGQFQGDVQALVQAVESNAESMTQAASTLSNVATNTDEQADAAAAASQEASANVQTVATAAEELSASITEIGTQVEKTTSIVGDAAQHAQSTNAQVEQLAETANKIGSVISLIQEIAEQTNLLALNATIEAARAGEAGKGFAVVASEVKGLANQTAKATGDIASQISEIQTSTQQSVEAIKQITSTMSQVNAYMGSIATSVDHQGTATDEISHSVTQAANGTQLVVSNINGVTEATTQTAQAAEEVNRAAASVTQNTERLNDTISTFLRSVAAA